ncbi:hypothetical protein [uncultured Microbacterium sp.]|uniref:flagellar hook-length control protein FliK n=1 Tax=uncultured Microbacterium sp. TaxID=191216 RepID=UPI0028D1773E|nr:hypothetical protein [uncultured Microbacterium sp.]
MTAVSLLGAVAADPSAAGTASGRETGESGTPFDEIIVQVRELATQADGMSREGSSAAGEGDLAPAQADARDLAAAAALLGVVEETPAAPEASADPRGAQNSGSVDAETSGTVAAALVAVPPPTDAATVSTVLDGGVGSHDAPSGSSASVPAAPSFATPTSGAPTGVGGSGPLAAPGAAGAPADQQGALQTVRRGAAELSEAQPAEADPAHPLRAAGPEQSAAGAAGVPRTGESAAPPPVRTLSSLPAPMGSYADIMAASEASDGEGAGEPLLTAGDRAVSLPAATSASGSGAGSGAATIAAGLSAVAQKGAVSASPAVAASDAAPEGARAVAAQMTPAVLSIAQRPAGTHQLVMTVNPESLGPVTVRAQIGQAGEVQVELIGGTDAGRDALRSIVADLRRDLAAVSPHATLSVSTGVSADPGPGRGGHPGSEAAAGEQGGRGDAAPEQRGHRPGADRGDELAHIIRITTSTRAAGEGLDTFA